MDLKQNISSLTLLLPVLANPLVSVKTVIGMSGNMLNIPKYIEAFVNL
jgi:hypothetical protein